MSTRRSFLKHIASGVAAGTAGALVWQASKSGRTRQFGVIGHDDSQLWLLDIPEARVLVALGPINDRLLKNLPSLATVERQTIEMLIADHSLLASHGIQMIRNHAVQQVIAVQSTAQVEPLGFEHVSVPDFLSIQLTNDVVLQLTVAAASMNADDNAPWALTLETPHYVASLASAEHALPQVSQSPLLVGIPAISAAPGGVEVLVTNPTDEPLQPLMQVQASVSDPTWFELAEREIRMPNRDAIG